MLIPKDFRRVLTSLPRIIQERETREKLKREKAEVRVRDAYVNDKPLTFRQREAKEKKEVGSGSSDPDNHTLTDSTRGLQAEERERKEVQSRSSHVQSSGVLTTTCIEGREVHQGGKLQSVSSPRSHVLIYFPNPARREGDAGGALRFVALLDALAKLLSYPPVETRPKRSIQI